jgi:hypothetical protein
MEENELISGSGGKGGKGGHVPVESNDTLKSKQAIKLLFAVAEGEITSIDDILLDKVSISSYKASYAWKSGLSNQTVIPGFIDTESPLPTFTSVALVKATLFTYNIDSLVDAVRLTLGLDSLRQIQENGDMTGFTVSIEIYTKATTVAGLVLYKTSTKKGKASNPYSWDVIVDRPTNYVPGTNWSVVVNRLSDDDTSVKRNSVTRLIAITQIYHKQLTYPGTALVAISLEDANEFGGRVPQILIKGKGRKVLVPSNYNPVTRVYTGTWNLSMNSVKQFSDNIAWVLYDVLHDPTCLDINSADIDKTSFYLLSQYADTLIPDGYGVNIPRYSIGNQFFSRDNVPTFIQNLLSICNGMLTENEFGQIKVIFDQPNLSASRLVTNANVVAGLFNYSSNDLENRYSLVNVTYNNYLSYNETDTATWSDNALITRYGLQTSDIVLPGCIYEAQAIRKARWAVYTNAITTKLLTFNVMFEGLSFRNGSIIKVMDSDNAGVNQHGIIKGTSVLTGNTTIVMDRSITLAAQTYTVTFYGIDGVTLYNKTLLQTNSTVSSISFVGTEVPLLGSTFILSGTVTPQLFRVVGNAKNSDDSYTISCLVYDTDKFTYIDQGITLGGGTGDFINIDGFYAPAVFNLAVSPISSSNGVNNNIQLDVHWDWDLLHAQKYKATFQATWIRDNTDIKEVKEITGNSFDINGAVPGTYDITVWAINPFSGIKSTPATLSYSYRTTAGNSTLLPPVNARVSGTVGLIYNTPALSLLFDYNTLNDNVSDSLLDYVVELWTLTGTTKVGTYVVKPNLLFGSTFNFPFLENLAIFGASTRSYIIKLYSRDLTGFVSTAYAVTVNNTVPVLQSFTILSGVSSVYIKVTTTPYEIDTAGYEVHRSLTTGFTPGVGTLVYDGLDTYITLNVPDTQTYYYRIAAYDDFDKVGLTYSSQQSNTALTTEAITWSKTGLVFSVGTTNQLTWTAGTIIKSGTTTYSGVVAGNATWTTGTLYAYFNPGLSATIIQTTTSLSVAVGIGCFPIATYTGGAVTNIKGGTGDAFISGSQIIAGTVGASQIIAGSIVASLLDVNNAVITGEAQIASAVITNAAIKDHIQSSNYNPTAHTGWKLDKVANMITTYGGLQILDSTGATILSSGTSPTWNWDNIIGPGIPADNATRNVFKGNWSSATVSYVVGDIVLDTLGYGWSCILAHTSSASILTPVYPITANTYWTLYVVKGTDGAEASNYALSLSSSVISKSVLNVLTPTSSTAKIYKTTGTASPVLYAGRFIIATSSDGTTYTDVYTSSADESSKAYIIPVTAKTIRVRAYLAGGVTTLLDEEVITIVTDGSSGIDSVNNIVAVLSNENQSIPADNAGVTGVFSAVSTMSVYNGAVDDSANWTYAKVDSNTTSTITGAVATVTALSADSGTVTITATRSAAAQVNILSGSETFDATQAWYDPASLGWTASYASTLSNIPAPNGALTARRIVTGAGLVLFYRKGNITFPAGQYSVSTYVYVPTQAGINNWNVGNDFADAEAAGGTVYTVFDKWVRFENTLTTTLSRGFLDWNINMNGTGLPAGAVFHVWGAMCKTGAASGKYIPYLAPVSKVFTLAKAKAGTNGATGLTGSAGTNGTNGTNGATLYTWLKYADTTTTGMSDLPAGKTYMGIAYNKTVATESTIYTDYDWSLIKGTDGINGLAGTNTYTWVKYGTSAAGAGLNDSPTGMTYIGLAFNKTTATESGTPGDYTWSLIHGAAGTNGTNGTNGATGATGATGPAGTTDWAGLVNKPTFGNFAYLSSIDSANISTYIAAAAIGTAYIANAAITNAQIANLSVSTGKIANLAVDSLQIAGNAVTVPLSAYTAASIVTSSLGLVVQTLTTGIISTTIASNLCINFGLCGRGTPGGTWGQVATLKAGTTAVYSATWIHENADDQAASGCINYTLPANTSVQFTLVWTSPSSIPVSNRFINIMTTKR